MSLFVLIDETNAYWWLRKGGFSLVGHLQPMIFRSREQAQQKAENLRQSYGFDLHPELLRAPGSKK